MIAAERDRDQALDQARLASMALAMGRNDLAERALRGAVGTMTNFRADGEFAATIGAESSKEWKGEPYEKMAAYLTLGVLLHGEGDRGNALAMYKSSVLADTGTAEQRYRSDFVPGWVMQALAYQAEGEIENATQFMNRGIDARWSRAVIEALSATLIDVRSRQHDPDQVNDAKAVLLAALSAGATAAPRDPTAAARATVSYASDLLLAQQQLPGKKRLPTLQGFSKGDFEDAGEALPAIAERWQERVAELPDRLWDDQRRFAAQMNDLLSTQPNVVLLIERGRGPRKAQAGRYGQILQIVPGREPEAPGVYINERRQPTLWLDSLSYQATTRGGRRVDGFLQGKAVFKDASLITGAILLEVAEAAARSSEEEVAGALLVAGAALYVSGLFTNPAADIRQWELLPESWYLVTTRLEPGEHPLQIERREYTLSVPARGQLVALVPQLAPGGAPIIGTE